MFTSLQIENMSLIEITGEAGSGKTQFGIYFILKTILPSSFGCLEKGVLYISSVQKISMNRFDQFFSSMSNKMIEKEKNQTIARLFKKHFTPMEFEQFFSVEVEEFINENNIKTIIVDSITGVADTQFINEKNEMNYKDRTKFLKNYLWMFKNLIQKYNLFFFVTNNVTANFSDSGENVKPSLGMVLENSINTRILLKKEKNDKGEYVRSFKVLYSNSLPLKEINFSLTNQGIEFWDK